MNTNVYQIYYNEETKVKILPGFIPLDNMKNEKPDWFEFHVILNFLRENKLEDNTWYGFLSPKFSDKTGYTADFVNRVLKMYGDAANVALFSPGWDQLAYFLNPFEQGDFWHPGLMSASQNFINYLGLNINLESLVTDNNNSVFCNYVIAKKEYWIAWKEIAEVFIKFVESDKNYQVNTSYGSTKNQYPLKTFIQERFPTIILSQGKYQILSPDRTLDGPIFTKLFSNDLNTRKLLLTCDLMKTKYRDTGEKAYLDMYSRVRKRIKFLI